VEMTGGVGADDPRGSGEQEGEVDRVEHALLSGVPEHWGHRRSWRGVAGGIVKQEGER